MVTFKHEIERGTHKDVFVFPELYTIAVNYENIPEVIDEYTGHGYLLTPDKQVSIQGTYFSSSAFFFDYKAAARDAFNDLLWRIGLGNEWEEPFVDPRKYPREIKGRYRPVGRVYYGAMKPNRKGNTYPFIENFRSMWDNGEIGFSESDWAASHKWYMIFYAWKEWLKATKQRPPIDVLSEFYYTVFNKLAINYNTGGTRDFIFKSGNRGFFTFGERDRENPWKSWYEEYQKMNDYERLNFVHPLTHFPPLDHSSLLHDTVFYGPSLTSRERVAKYEEMKQYYGQEIADRIKSNYNNTDITYGELIIPRGYNFDINLTPLGIPSSYSLNYDDFSYTQQTMFKMPLTPGHITRVVGGVQEEIFNAFYWPPPHIAADKAFGSRDWTIMNWLAGRIIPPDLKWLAVVRDSKYNPWSHPARLSYTSACGYQGAGRELCYGPGSSEPFMLRGLPPNDLYKTGELQFIASDEDPFKFFKQLAIVAASITMSVITGNIAPLVKSASDILVQVTTAISPDAGKYAGIIIPIIGSSLIKKYGTDPEQISQAAKALTNLSAPIISNMTSSAIEMIKNDNQEILETMAFKVPERTLSILEAVAERTLGDLLEIEEQITRVVMDPSVGIQKPVSFSTNQASLIMNDAIRKKKESKIILWGSIGLGAALLLKYLKK